MCECRVRHAPAQSARGKISSSIPESASVAGVETQLAASEEHGQILHAIGLLPKKQAAAMLMHVVEDIPYRDIAKALRCREATVRKHMLRARTKLRSTLAHLMPVARKEEPSSV